MTSTEQSQVIEFNTLQDLKNADFLLPGMIVRTLCREQPTDGLGSTYLVLPLPEILTENDMSDITILLKINWKG